jgi:hypothetical protein
LAYIAYVIGRWYSSGTTQLQLASVVYVLWCWSNRTTTQLQLDSGSLFNLMLIRQCHNTATVGQQYLVWFDAVPTEPRHSCSWPAVACVIWCWSSNVTTQLQLASSCLCVLTLIQQCHNATAVGQQLLLDLMLIEQYHDTTAVGQWLLVWFYSDPTLPQHNHIWPAVAYLIWCWSNSVKTQCLG